MQVEASNIEKVENIVPFLKAYPFPAFIHCSPPNETQGLDNRRISLHPAWSNRAFDTLFVSYDQFLTAIGLGEPLVAYGLWLEARDGLNDDEPMTHRLTLKIPWIDEGNDGLESEVNTELELVKSMLLDPHGQLHAIITSIPRAPLPKHGNAKSSLRHKKSRKRRNKPIKLYDLPTFRSSTAPPTAKPDSLSGSSATESGSSLYGHGGGPKMSEMVANYPWEKTPLGPQDQWDPCLKQAVQLTLSTPYPAATWWGPDLVLIYNDAYAEMSTTKHPRIFGQKGLEAWDELWETLGPALKTCMEGNPVYKKDDLLLMDRLENEEQSLEETYHSWSWTPILGADQKFYGVFNGTHETSSKVIAERRMNTLQLLGSRSSVAQNQEAFCQAAISSLNENDKDIPFAALYLMDADAPLDELEDALTTPQGPEIPRYHHPSSKLMFKLRGCIGFPAEHPYLPTTVRVVMNSLISPSVPEMDTELFSWPFQQAIASREPIRVSIPPSVSEGIEQRGWGDRVSHAIIMTLSSDADAKPLGIVILGLNTRRPFDADYSRWVDVLRSSLGSYLDGSISREEEVKRAENLSQLDAAKTALFSNASHELRTPLTLIAGPITECINEITEPTIQKKLVMAARNIDRLTRLVDSLMDFSRLEAGRLEGRYSPVLFGSYVADLASVFKAVVEKAKLEYTITYDENETRT
ncbi:hypothetical protein FRC14_002922, partial [Serendipita sp. 396]